MTMTGTLVDARPGSSATIAQPRPARAADDGLQALAREVIERRPRPATPFGLYLLRSDDPAAGLARRVEAEVFGEAFGNTPDLLAAEYGPYEAASVYCCVLDHRRARPVGALRLILPGPAGLKSLVDIEAGWGRSGTDLLAGSDVGYEAERTWDIATLAVAAGYRDGLVSQALYQGACTSARRCGASALVTILDVRVLRLVQRCLGRPFRRHDGVAAANYLDSPASLPVWCDFEEWRRRVERSDEVLHEVVFEGRGLEAVVSPPDWDDFWSDRGAPHAPPPPAATRAPGTAAAVSGAP
jgi:hypothetical protein